jgi:hypothetical protein
MSVFASYGGESHIVLDRGTAMGKCAASALCAITVGLSAAMFWPGNGTAILPAFAQSSAQRSLASAGQSLPQTEAVEVIVKDYLNTHPEEIERVVKDYILAHPEVLREAITTLMKARMPQNVDKSAEVRSNAAALFNSGHQVTLGNPDGDVTLVEFFDYVASNNGVQRPVYANFADDGLATEWNNWAARNPTLALKEPPNV